MGHRLAPGRPWGALDQGGGARAEKRQAQRMAWRDERRWGRSLAGWRLPAATRRHKWGREKIMLAFVGRRRQGDGTDAELTCHSP